MKKALVLLAMVFGATSCVNPSGPVIDAQLNALQGQPANAAFYRLGYPNSEGEVANTKFYVWSTSSAVLVPTTSTTTGFATVGKKTVSYDQTTTGPDEVVPVACTIRLFVNANNAIISHDYTGDQTGCAFYAQKLDPNYRPSSL